MASSAAALWYDPTPHPNDSSLASTHPHHKHVPPDVKHHRIPAPGLSFTPQSALPPPGN
ncbi:MAG: toxin-antitoxin system TumE family protein [Anaerolineae bacterium]